MTSFFLKCVPPKTTSQQKGVMIIGGKPRFFKKKKIESSERLLSLMLAQHRPAEPIGGALIVSVDWVYPWLLCHTKADKAKGRIPCDTRPDVDNLCKTLMDCMTKVGFWSDDAQVASLLFRKWWGEESGIGITIDQWRN